MSELRWQVPSAGRLEELLQASLPLGLRSGPARLTFHRELYFDTPQGDLRRRDIRCRVRFDVEDHRWLTLDARDRVVRCEARVGELEPRDIVLGASEPARRLRAVVDPSRLEPQLELDVERRLRIARFPALPLPQFVFAYDRVAVRGVAATLVFHELALWRRPWALLPLAPVAGAVARRYGLAAAALERAERAAQLRNAPEPAGEGAAGPRRQVAVLALAHGRMALCRVGTELRLPTDEGGGEDGCRRVLRRSFGHAEGEVRLLGVVPAAEARPAIEVWLARRLRRDLAATPPGAIQWFPPAEIVGRVGSPVLREPVTLAALAVAARSELVPEWSAAPPQSAELPSDDGSRMTLSELRVPLLRARALEATAPAPEQFINAHLSSLEFTARVLALAEDPSTPLFERLRFLAIVSTNLDHFFMVEVGALKHAVAAGICDRSPDGLTPVEELDAIAIRLHPLVARQYRAFRNLAQADLVTHGIRLRDWSELEADERTLLDRHFADEIAPLLTPKALTRAPGHPFPRGGDRRLSLAVTLRDEPGGPVHFAAVELPPAPPRFLTLGGGGAILLETVVRARLATLFPGREVVEAHAFRVTRAGDIQLDELATTSFLQAVAEEVRRRPWGPVVRLEVEHTMPPALRDLLQRELRFEESGLQSALGPSDVYEAHGPLDLGALGELATGEGGSGSCYPDFAASDPFAGERSLLDALDHGDVLVHHPYDSFAASFERFIAEAADDPAVAAIKLTLYRPGGPSAIGEALRRAAGAGKDVSVFVELKARFDEQLNIGWAQSLEAAGIHVVTGLATLKTHAKIALVVRRTDGGRRTRCYAHIGSGNYNPDTARSYTDLGLFTADAAIAEDLHRLFNELTGSGRPPQAEFRRLLVAPTNMLDRFVALIAREADHARAGRGGRIRAKLNGLADATVIRALYRASQAGVAVDLVVRGTCMLRPGVPGLSERIRVVSLLGRFLEHGRIYHFANAGAPEYYIGSADWRPRNLRRRVEVITPVHDPAARARLDRILERELTDPTVWTLQSDGSYARLSDPRAPGAGERLILERASAPHG